MRKFGLAKEKAFSSLKTAVLLVSTKNRDHLVLTKRSAASGGENEEKEETWSFSSQLQPEPEHIANEAAVLLT